MLSIFPPRYLPSPRPLPSSAAQSRPPATSQLISSVHNSIIDKYSRPGEQHVDSSDNEPDWSAMKAAEELTAGVHLCVQANILTAVAWLVTDCQPSDSLFFSFSGHGCQPPHPTGGSWDEGILPSDFQQVSQFPLVLALAAILT